MLFHHSAGKMSTQNGRSQTRIIHQGWLMKRGEHIRNWRPRYFQLFDDGSFLGYKNRPQEGMDEEPCNDFCVKDVQLLKVESPRPNTFLMRGLHVDAPVERMFHADSPFERQVWIDRISEVSAKLRCCLPSAKPAVLEGFEALAGPSNASLQDFDLFKVLGRGRFGKVILCKEKGSGKSYAMKVIRKQLIIDTEEVEHTLAENRVLQKANHPFLPSLAYSFQTDHHLCFVMEFAVGGELFFHLKRHRVFPEEWVRFYGAEITLAIGYLHSQHIFYRDMKLENLLLDKDGHIKVADFGLVKEDIAFGDKTHTFCGTAEYFAPEILACQQYGRSVDWWGTGLVMYEMLCGRLPFYSEDHEVLFRLILTGTVRYPSALSHYAKALLSALLVRNPAKRLGCGPEDAKEVMSHPFFESINWDLLYQKKIEPPFKPEIKCDTDTSYFDDEFTLEPVQLTPPPSETVHMMELLPEENEDEEEEEVNENESAPPTLRRVPSCEHHLNLEFMSNPSEESDLSAFTKDHQKMAARPDDLNLLKTNYY